MLEIAFSGVVLLVGAPGSGKTEVSINLALNYARENIKVNLVDLDLVNPYFRAREVRYFLNKNGVRTVLPPDKYLYADLPILTPVISGIIKDSKTLSILDVGGGGIGSTVLGSLIFDHIKIQTLFVVNPYRPQTSSIEYCLKMCEEIESSSKLKISGLIGNSNIIAKTGFQEVYSGYKFMLALSEKTGVPISFITMPEGICNNLNLEKIKIPILAIKRYLFPPWDNFKKC